MKADIQRKLHQCNQGIEQTRVCRRENVCVFAEHQQRYQPFGQVLWHMSGIRKCKPERATETPWHSHQPMQNPCNRSVWCQNGTLPSNLQLLLKVAHRDTDNQNNKWSYYRKSGKDSCNIWKTSWNCQRKRAAIPKETILGFLQVLEHLSNDRYHPYVSQYNSFTETVEKHYHQTWKDGKDF